MSWHLQKHVGKGLAAAGSRRKPGDSPGVIVDWTEEYEEEKPADEDRRG